MNIDRKGKKETYVGGERKKNMKVDCYYIRLYC